MKSSAVAVHWERLFVLWPLGTPELFYSFASYNAAQTIYRYDLAKKRAERLGRRIRVPLTAHNLQLEQVWYESKDKTRVPMFLFHKKGMKQDPATPVLLTGYERIRFEARLRLLGVVIFVLAESADTRRAKFAGGGEYGEAWHRCSACWRKSRNVFDDFEYAAQWLIDNKYNQRCATFDLWREQWRPAGRRGTDAEARVLPSCRLRLSARRHVAVP